MEYSTELSPTMTRKDAEVAGANWAVAHARFGDYSQLRLGALIEAEQRFAESDLPLLDSLEHGFVMGAMSVRKECCARKGF